MCDLPAFYTEYLIDKLNDYIQSGKTIHTLVLWTKHPQALLCDPLYSFLVRLKTKGIQLYIHLSITGMGGMPELEPFVPPMNKSLKLMPHLIDLTSEPERICIRIDPIVNLRMKDESIFSNLDSLHLIINQASQFNIRRFVFSFLEAGIYAKVDARFFKAGIKILPIPEQKILWLKTYMAELKFSGILLEACCVKTFPDMACVDGFLLSKLHKNENTISLKRPYRRPKCACTASIDIGVWPPKLCKSGCLYCYARPINYR